MAREEEIINSRLKKLEELKKQKINPYAYSFNKEKDTVELQEEFKNLKSGSETKNKVKIAGRIKIIRDIGKLIFADLQDGSGRIQLQLQEEENKKALKFFKDFVDAGDFVGVEGNIIRTKRGELSVLVEKVELLAKAIKPLPEKWHGLQDKEERYRKRYLDLIMSPEVKEVFIKRATIIDEIRKYLKEKEFLEVETPALQSIYGGASARPFKTHLNALKIDLFLAISPELYLKRLVVGGFEKVFTISKNFRNEGIDAFHNPEFTMLEFYYAYQNYEKLIEMTEELVERLKKKLGLRDEIEYQGKKINLKTPFKRTKFRDLMLDKTKIDIDKADNFEKLKKEIISKRLKDVNIQNCKHYGALLDELYKRVVRPSIIQPIILTHYPVEMIALAKRNEKDPRKINTFQLIIDGAEIIKAYDELNDPLDQEERLKEQAKLLKIGNEEAMPMDEDFVNALKIGMPPTAGYGMGIDRLCILLTNQPSIRDVILFPFMKPE
ncbi:lysine--tRNA ligase [Candidatus Pacearchaeota archaeon CG06_land_8_20_14_3_00_35_12]|nr:MAG: lysine--tRNA ligase [Candidatus Pacearchaeota archaeon CG06_land_8_20_14_3_00_35_12]